MSFLKCPTGREKRMWGREAARQKKTPRTSVCGLLPPPALSPASSSASQQACSQSERSIWPYLGPMARRSRFLVDIGAMPDPGSAAQAKPAGAPPSVGGGRGFICSQSEGRKHSGSRPIVRRQPGPRQIRRKRTESSR